MAERGISPFRSPQGLPISELMAGLPGELGPELAWPSGLRAARPYPHHPSLPGGGLG